MKARRLVLFVLGQGRSGTSALARVLSLCGGALPADVRPADDHNPRGYWEPRATLVLNETILRRHGSAGFDPSLRLLEDGAFDAEEKAAWTSKIGAFLSELPDGPLVVIKDTHITALCDLWFEAAHTTGLDVAAVIALRHPQEVIASLAAAGPTTPELSSALWLKNCLLAERNTRGVARVFIDYANLLEDWRREMSRISAAIGVDLDARDENAIEEFLAPSLRRQRFTGQVTERFGTDWISAVYGAMRAAARDEPWDSAVLDRVFEEYRVCEHDFRTAIENSRELWAMGADRAYSNSLLYRLSILRMMRAPRAMVNRHKGLRA
ncbi:hypothetical protein AU198_03720 [Mycobacterium sp. GA-1199]|uniref:sulfotransferase family protein n=1 Tax=Mycobacterium sp. GA-1199 TaxID=1772287 RepID=UPI000748ADAF|nr:sulfotransferase family protein [Mycobacterium sp. GA-1199]KUI46769.1 hypothetical protein AU198_03720 [Mycobacterium sp. GA-1199]